MTKYALITGASSGIGAALRTALEASGYTVLGTSRTPSAGSDLLPLDVCSDASVAALARSVDQRFGHLDLLVNNAGQAMVGAVEEVTTDEARALFETNVFGLHRVTAALLPALRRGLDPRIVNIGSFSGFVAVPFHGWYAASKHAVAALSEALALELAEQRIRLSLVEPDVVATGIVAAGPARRLPHYTSQAAAAEGTLTRELREAPPPDRVVRAVLHAATARRPRLRYRVGARPRLVWRLRPLLPERLFQRAIAWSFGLSLG